MKKYILKIVLFFGIVVVIDFGFGMACEWLLDHARGGEMKSIKQTAMEQNADIVILGSSRAHHHYVPSVLADSLGLIAYNGGVDGNGIVLAWGLYQMITDRYYPKLLIYDVTTGFDIQENPADGKDIRYLGNLRPYSMNSKINSIVSRIDPLERYKCISAMFRYNSKIVDLVKDQLSSRGLSTDGYCPLFGELKGKAIPRADELLPTDNLKLEMLEKLVSKTKHDNVKIVVVASPKRGAVSSYAFLPIRDVCMRYNIEFWDYYTDSCFQRNDYFQDNVHLNDKGAKAFTGVIAHRLLNNKDLNIKNQ